MWYLYKLEFYSATKNEICSKWVELENIISQVKLARLRKPKDTCFLSYVKYRPNTKYSNTMKNRSLKGRSHMRGGD
jgi:hypothetical protein